MKSWWSCFLFNEFYILVNYNHLKSVQFPPRIEVGGEKKAAENIPFQPSLIAIAGVLGSWQWTLVLRYDTLNFGGNHTSGRSEGAVPSRGNGIVNLWNAYWFLTAWVSEVMRVLPKLCSPLNWSGGECGMGRRGRKDHDEWTLFFRVPRAEMKIKDPGCFA